MDRGFDFSSGPFSFNPVHRFQTSSIPIICQCNSTTKLWNAIQVMLLIRAIANWNCHFPRNHSFFSLIPIILSFIFISNSSPTNKGLLFFLNCFGGSPTSFCKLENLLFQFLVVVRFKVYCWYFCNCRLRSISVCIFTNFVFDFQNQVNLVFFLFFEWIF